MATTGAASAVAAKPVASAPASGASAAAPAENRPSWQQIVRWMDNDPRTMTAPLTLKTRDPFEYPKAEVVDREAEEETKPHAPKITPSSAGLALTGTIVGPRNRLAQINGKTYAVGQSIEINNKETAVHAAFKLMEVHPRHVVLQSGSERFELTLPEPGKSDKIEITLP